MKIPIPYLKFLREVCLYYAGFYDVDLVKIKLYLFFKNIPENKGLTNILVYVGDQHKVLTNKEIKEIILPKIKKLMPLLALLGNDTVKNQMEGVNFIENLGKIIEYYSEKEGTTKENITGLINNTKDKRGNYDIKPFIYKDKMTIKIATLTDPIINEII